MLISPSNEHADEAVDASGLIVTHLTQLYGKFEQYFSAESMADLESKIGFVILLHLT